MYSRKTAMLLVVAAFILAALSGFAGDPRIIGLVFISACLVFCCGSYMLFRSEKRDSW